MARCFGLLVDSALDTERHLLDQLARRLACQYAAASARHARLFRNRLDQYLGRRERPAISWDGDHER